jgi:hypothetical protein
MTDAPVGRKLPGSCQKLSRSCPEATEKLPPMTPMRRAAITGHMPMRQAAITTMHPMLPALVMFSSSKAKGTSACNQESGRVNQISDFEQSINH